MTDEGFLHPGMNDLGFGWSKRIVWTPDEREMIYLPVEPRVSGDVEMIAKAVERVALDCGCEEWAGLLFVGESPVLFSAFHHLDAGGLHYFGWIRLPVQALVDMLAFGETIKVRLGMPGEVVRTRTRRQRKGYVDEQRARLRWLYVQLRKVARKIPKDSLPLAALRSQLKAAAIYPLADFPDVAVEHILRGLEGFAANLRAGREKTAETTRS